MMPKPKPTRPVDKERTVKVIEWLGHPITRQFFSIIQAEVRIAREGALNAAERGLQEAAPSAATAKALREVLTDAVDTLCSEEAYRDHLKEAPETCPEDLSLSRLADGLEELQDEEGEGQ